jgi:ElaB/YqjD/DUF883 family membrane-anchored ribosome-binding protein
VSQDIEAQIDDVMADVDGLLLQLGSDQRHRAAQARGQLQAVLDGLKRAKGFLQASSSGYSFIAVKPVGDE